MILSLAGKRKIIFTFFIIGSFLPIQGRSLQQEGLDPSIVISEYQRVMEWRKERDEFSKIHVLSPLSLKERKNFKGLKYYPFDTQFIFPGQIERYNFHINDPRYCSTFLTNKGTTKRYIRYGKFHFRVDDKEYGIEIYKSILGDPIFIPFKDPTNGQETYEGGRYIDAEILVGYKMILDFNMAYHPPCAYNHRVTCVIPPRGNMLDVAIRAGEKN